MLCYVIPGLAYVRSFKEPHTLRTLAIAQLIFGCVIGPTAVVIILLQAAGVL